MKYINKSLSIERVKVQDIAKKFGTPTYCYSYGKLKENIQKKMPSATILYKSNIEVITDEKYKVDIFLGIGGGPEGVVAASALDSYNCFFQGRFLFETDKDKSRAQKMGINDFQKKYELNEMVRGDSIFCATGITDSDVLSGISFDKDKCSGRMPMIDTPNFCASEPPIKFIFGDPINPATNKFLGSR